jgi:hypothetical protein
VLFWLAVLLAAVMVIHMAILAAFLFSRWRTPSLLHFPRPELLVLLIALAAIAQGAASKPCATFAFVCCNTAINLLFFMLSCSNYSAILSLCMLHYFTHAAMSLLSFCMLHCIASASALSCLHAVLRRLSICTPLHACYTVLLQHLHASSCMSAPYAECHLHPALPPGLACCTVS